MLIPVQVGSEWVVAGSDVGARLRMRVEAIENGVAHCRSIASGRRFDLSVSTLARGRRGASLVLQADGTPFEKPGRRRTSRASPTDASDRTASDFRRVVKPRSAPTPRALQAAMLIRDGVGRQDVAARMGVSTSCVTKWCAQVREEGL